MEQIHAPLFEQVDSNVDELVELRGLGRYFGVLDPKTGESADAKLGPICANCHKRGHLRAKCKIVVCHKCGVVGDHYETQCPTTIVCAKCGDRGHKAIDCTNKVKKRQYCKNCDLFNHTDDTCPNIWRSYILKNYAKPKMPVMYCYNCGDKGHYGDDCKSARMSRIPNIAGSAFSGSNLPVDLRKPYFASIHDNALPKKPRSSGYSSYNSGNSGYNSYNSGYNNYNSGYNSGYNNYNSGYNNNYNNYSNNYNTNYTNNYSNYSNQLPKKPSLPKKPTRPGKRKLKY